jgi:class 3 adenylate cyclase
VRNRRRLEAGDDRRLHILPWREFVAELLFWMVAGLLMGAGYLGLLQAPLESAAKVLLGCFSFGLLGGMLCYLSFEKRLIGFLRAHPEPVETVPGRLLSVSWKMFFFMATVLVLMAGAVLFMVYLDINFLLENREGADREIYAGVFKEIVFAFGVLLFLSSLIIVRFSRNLHEVLGLQLSVMEEIGRGNYQQRVPIVSSDEFGLIAAKTNEMMEGLRERDFCEVSFGRYMAPEVSERILHGEIPSEGEVREATVLFCDLRGYTSFVEESAPREVVGFLNEYFTEMEQAVKQLEGIVLQYIGDEIEAVFGAPDDLPDHEEKAVQAALHMRRRLAELNRRRIERGEEPVSHGVGVHTGEVLAGSVGSPERLVYALVGDTVNVASRIQDLNKQFGTDILVSEVTRRRVKREDLRFESLGKTLLRGKRQELEIYRVL